MDCPVCGNKKISPFATHCLECGADVLAFPLLDDLEEQCVVTLKEKISLEGELTALSQLRKKDKRGYQKRMNRMYWFLFLFPLLFFWCAKKPIVNKVEINKLEAKNDSLENNIKFLKAEIDSLSRIPIKETSEKVIHIVEKGDNLFLLAEKYLGNGADWPILAKLNPHIKNNELIIPKDTLMIKLR